MALDIPPIFECTVEVDETYLGGSWRNKHKSTRVQGSKRGRVISTKHNLGFCVVMARRGQR